MRGSEPSTVTTHRLDGPNVSNAAAPGSVYGAPWKATRVPSGDHDGRDPKRLIWNGVPPERAMTQMPPRPDEW